MTQETITYQDIDPSLLTLISVKDRVLDGALNENTLWLDQGEGLFYIRRVPKQQREAVLETLEREYLGVGFLQEGGSFTLRSVKQQIEFARHACALGLPVVVPPYFEPTDNAAYVPFIHGVPYDRYLQLKTRYTQEVVVKYLKSILDAHQKDVVYGDRWGPNTLVDSRRNIWHIDFDIMLHGRYAPEFEMAQAIYYSIYFARDRQTSLLACANFARMIHTTTYSSPAVMAFLIGHGRYFGTDATIYGGIQPEIAKFVSLISHEQNQN